MIDSVKPSRARGQLEADLLRVLWDSPEPLNAAEIVELIPGKKPAHTTILTSLTRLQSKGLVNRVGTAGRGIKFQATQSESERAGQVMLDTLRQAQDRAGVLLKFAGNLEAEDLELLKKALS